LKLDEQSRLGTTVRDPASVDPTDARYATVRRFGRSDVDPTESRKMLSAAKA
jgi:hypothetical protein